MTSLLVLGFFIGMRHALEADHVAAVASLATQTSNKPLKSALSGGLGHTLTLFAFGSVVLLTDLFIPEQAAHTGNDQIPPPGLNLHRFIWPGFYHWDGGVIDYYFYSFTGFFKGYDLDA